MAKSRSRQLYSERDEVKCLAADGTSASRRESPPCRRRLNVSRCAADGRSGVATRVPIPFLLLVILLLVDAAASPAGAQAPRLVHPPRIAQPFFRFREAPGDEESNDNVFLPADRRTLQDLSKSRELLEQGRYGEAVRYLGAILDAPEDYFFQPDKKAPIHRSLKAEAQRLIGQLPPAGREYYELQYGARARKMLESAVRAGDVARLAEVSRRFFHTQSGYQAAFLLGMDHFEHGRPLAAALTLQRLRDAQGENDRFEPALSLATATCWLQVGMADKARAILVALRRQHPAIAIEIGGRSVPIFSKDSECTGWLAALVGPGNDHPPRQPDRWLMFRGDPARNAATAGSAPLLNLRWRVSSTDDPAVEGSLEQLSKCYQGMGTPIMSGLHPLAVNGVVLMRTARNLLAVDFHTGKRLWEVPAEEGRESGGEGAADDPLASSSPVVTNVLCQRMLDNMTYGTLSSDGRYVYSIEDLDRTFNGGAAAGIPMGLGGFGGRRVVIGNRRGSAAPALPSNRLAAHDVRSGKLKWQLGGPAGPYALRQAETFFLGPPLPLTGQLYVLAESKGEVRLLALEAASGNLLWSQPLTVVEQNVLPDPQRRTAGVSPAYADGILVCPTSTGALVGLDLATRSLLWGYSHGGDRHIDRRRGFGMVPFPQYDPEGRPRLRWTDASVCIHEGRLLATPTESQTLQCLNLSDGRLLWKQPRQDDLYVACIDQDKVVLVGRHAVRAVRLADGQAAWDGRSVRFPEDSMPSGRGFLSRHYYYVPLTSAEVLGIDLKAGAPTHLSKSRRGEVPGNLICYRGQVLSQCLEGLAAFDQLDAAEAEVERRLKADPEDADSLTLRGEILLDQGNRAEALAALRRAYHRQPEPRTGELLREALFEGLRNDFARQRSDLADIESLLDNPAQRATYLRLMAAGLQQADQPLAAFDQYRQLIDLSGDRRPRDAIDQNWSVRRDRYVQAQLASLRRAPANTAVAAKIDEEIRKRLKAAQPAAVLDRLRLVLDYFGNPPAAEAAQAERLNRLKASGRWLDAEAAVWQATPQNDPSELARATARVIDLLVQAGRGDEAARACRWLSRRFPETACHEGKTVKQWIESLPAENLLRRQFAGKAVWPVGKVAVATSRIRIENVNISRFGRNPVEFQGDRGPFLGDATLQYDQNRRQLLGGDGLGHERWQASLVEEGQPPLFLANRGPARAAVCGHLLFLTMGYKIYAIDTLASQGEGGSRILWSHSLRVPGADAVAMRQFHQQFFNLPWQLQQITFGPLFSNQWVLGPVTGRYVSYQRFHSLLAVDPRSGATLWQRTDVPSGSRLFGDGEYLLAQPPGKAEAMLFRALDGELLGKRPLPRLGERQRFSVLDREFAEGLPLEESCIATVGRRLLLWRAEGPERVLRLFDPVPGDAGRNLWPPRKFSAGARAGVVDGEAVGVLEPSGHFVLLSLPDGRTIADVKLDPESALGEIVVMKSGDQYFLLTNKAPGRLPNRQQLIQPVPGYSFKSVVRGRLYAFDLRGRLQWPAAVVIRNQHLLLSQPARLPILTFACQVYDQRPRAPGRYQVKVLCVDKRTGRTVLRKEFDNPTGVFSLVGDPEHKAVSLLLQRAKVTLSFTDQPLPAAAAEEQLSGSEKPAKAPAALWKSIRRAFEQILEGTDDDDE